MVGAAPSRGVAYAGIDRYVAPDIEVYKAVDVADCRAGDINHVAVAQRNSQASGRLGGVERAQIDDPVPKAAVRPKAHDQNLRAVSGQREATSRPDHHRRVRIRGERDDARLRDLAAGEHDAVRALAHVDSDVDLVAELLLVIGLDVAANRAKRPSGSVDAGQQRER